MKKIQLEQSFELGVNAYKQGMKRVPLYDKRLSKLYSGRKLGETPTGEASTINIMKSWIRGWDVANIND